ncbi:MAG: NAD(P)H-hydrate dehydratase [Bacteroidetes bacterium]|nr:NAD(P)H-hydrate dehydratase [Bacteroidota bacterium]
MLITNSAQIREIERIMIEEYCYPSLLLMETAGRRCAEFLLRTYPDTRDFLILCGPGNNGGDGIVIARYLYSQGRHPQVFYTRPSTQMTGDVQVNFQILEKAGIPHTYYTDNTAADLARYLKETPSCVVVDALLGTGTRQALKSPVKDILDTVREYPQHAVVAIDLPSGLLGDTGVLLNEPLSCAHTLALELPKICHYVQPAAEYCGKVEVIDLYMYGTILDRLGIKFELLNDTLIREWYLPRRENTHKGSYGHVMLAGGSKGKPGAIGLAAQAALEVGAGLCTAFIPGSITTAFHRQGMEHMSIPYGSENAAYLNETAGDVFGSYLEDKSAVVLGPGLGNTPETAVFLRKALERIKLPTVLDADALNILAEHPDLWKLIAENSDGYYSNTVITPHPGEMARLLGVDTDDIQKRRYEQALKLAQLRKVVVVLKGAGTLIAAPNGTAYICTAGNAGMATAGAGDVLSGVVAGLMAQGYNSLKAAAMGVYLHASAGDCLTAELGPEGVTAGKISSAVSPVLHQIVD